MRHNPAVPLIGRLNVQVGVCWLTQLGLTAGIMLGWGGLPSLLRYREHWSSEPTASSNRARSPMENMIVDHDITRKEYGLLTLIISKRRPHTGKPVDEPQDGHFAGITREFLFIVDPENSRQFNLPHFPRAEVALFVPPLS
ncbi:hypothetical protein CTAM01_08898 [Colletotrichum tamarilloi]|uniref:Uncharacterized protein n=1 Tax=Colletotrichum tamarilloi TaxID=1209934 RepID=A0ABQ9R4I4_9PEZI|nr:uncharacterized protein CTAM01_08898 [Colletotrichum tamarilloi]KAK1494544.1 hypothetical protein CTAM01_08898 [Colletotrichum tamarilloi]